MFGKFNNELSRTNEKSQENRGIFNYLKSITKKVGQYFFEDDENNPINSRKDNYEFPTGNCDTSGIYDSPFMPTNAKATDSTPNEPNQLNFSSNSNIRLSNYNLLGSNNKEEAKSCESIKEKINDFNNLSKKKKVNPVVKILNYITKMNSKGNNMAHPSAFRKLNDNHLIGAGVNYKKIAEENEDIVKPKPIIVSSLDSKKRKRMRDEDSFDKINPKKSFNEKILKKNSSGHTSKMNLKIKSDQKTAKSKQDQLDKSLTKSNNRHKSFMNFDEIKKKNEFEKRKKIIAHYRKNCERRSQEFDYLRLGKSIDSRNSSKNQSKAEMEISDNGTKELDQNENFNFLNNMSQEEIKKDIFKMPEIPRKYENNIADSNISAQNSFDKLEKNKKDVTENPERTSNTHREFFKESENFKLENNKLLNMQINEQLKKIIDNHTKEAENLLSSDSKEEFVNKSLSKIGNERQPTFPILDEKNKFSNLNKKSSVQNEVEYINQNQSLDEKFSRFGSEKLESLDKLSEIPILKEAQSSNDAYCFTKKDIQDNNNIKINIGDNKKDLSIITSLHQESKPDTSTLIINSKSKEIVSEDSLNRNDIKDDKSINKTPGQILNKLQTSFVNSKKGEINDNQNIKNEVPEVSNEVVNITDPVLRNGDTISLFKKQIETPIINIFNTNKSTDTFEETKNGNVDNLFETTNEFKNSSSLLNNNNPFINNSCKTKSIFSSISQAKTKTNTESYNRSFLNDCVQKIENSNDDQSQSIINNENLNSIKNSLSLGKGESSIKYNGEKLLKDFNFYSQPNHLISNSKLNINNNTLPVFESFNNDKNEEDMVISPQIKPQQSNKINVLNFIDDDGLLITNKNNTNSILGLQNSLTYNNKIYFAENNPSEKIDNSSTSLFPMNNNYFSNGHLIQNSLTLESQGIPFSCQAVSTSTASNNLFQVGTSGNTSNLFNSFAGVGFTKGK